MPQRLNPFRTSTKLVKRRKAEKKKNEKKKKKKKRDLGRMEKLFFFENVKTKRITTHLLLSGRIDF
jgi:hypothetical protein